MAAFTTDPEAAALAEAANPFTTPERLRSLYSLHSTPKVRKALAKNASTPREILNQLFFEFHDEVMANPTMVRSLRADTKLIEDEARRRKFKIALDPTVPESTLRRLLEGPADWHREVIALRRDLSEEFLITLADHGFDVARLLQAPRAGVALWQKAARTRHKTFIDQNQIYLSRERDLPEEARQILEQQGDEEVLQSLTWRAEPPVRRETPPLEYAGADHGRLRGETHEDRFATFHDATVGLFVVADGASGAIRTGHIAAEKTRETLLTEITKADGPLRAQDFFHDAFYKAFHEIAGALPNYGEYRAHFHGRWFNTDNATATVAAVLIQGTLATIAHIGDCRVYLQRNDRLQCLTENHDLRWSYKKQGKELPEPCMHADCLFRSLGDCVTGTSPTLTRLEVATGDRLLLCSDGVYDALSEERLSAILQDHGSRDAVDQIVEEWRRTGGKDDMAVVVVGVS